MILGFFFIRPIPLPASELSYTLDHGVDTGYGEVATADVAAAVIFSHNNNSHSPLLGLDETDQGLHHTHHAHVAVASEYVAPESRGALELSPTRSGSPGSRRHSSRIRSVAKADALESLPNISGRRLWMNPDFYLLFVILSLCRCCSLSSTLLVMTEKMYSKRDRLDVCVHMFSTEKGSQF